MTIRQAYLRAVGYLRAYSSDSPEFDAAQLVEAVTGVSRGRLPLEGQEDITPTQWKKLRETPVTASTSWAASNSGVSEL